MLCLSWDIVVYDLHTLPCCRNIETNGLVYDLLFANVGS